MDSFLKSRQAPLLLLVILLAIAFLTVVVTVDTVDNDTYWLLALGQDVIENGVPHTDPLSMHSSMAYVSQQWLSAVIFRGTYNAFGLAGISALCRVADVIIVALAFVFCKEIGMNKRAAALTAFLAGFALVAVFGVARPHLFTYILFLVTAILLERFVKTGKFRYLIPLPFLSALQINLHASMWLLMIVLYAPYLVGEAVEWLKQKAKENPDEPKPENEKKVWKFLPTLCACAVSAVAGLLNPYGIQSVTYLFRSYGVKSISENVTEMQPVSLSKGPAALILVIAGFVLVALLRKHIRVRHILLFAGMAALTLSSAKGLSYLLLFGVPALVCGISNWMNEKWPPTSEEQPKKNRKVLVTVLLCVLSFAVVFGGIVKDGVKWSGDVRNAEQFGAKDAAVCVESAGLQKEHTIYTDYNTGGYFEFLGYKPYLDARAEAFITQNNGEFDYFVEYGKASVHIQYSKALLNKYQFDFIVADQYDAVHMLLEYQTELGICEYEKLPYGSEEEPAELNVWQKKNS